MSTFSFGTTQPAAAASGTTTSLFGSSTTQPASGSLFGSTQPSTGSLFGSTTTQPASGSLFGQPQQQTSLFGSTTTATSQPSLFGQQPAASSGGFFSALNPATSQPAATTSLFGAPATTTSAPSLFSGFGTTTTAPAASSAPSLFGGFGTGGTAAASTTATASGASTVFVFPTKGAATSGSAADQSGKSASNLSTTQTVKSSAIVRPRDNLVAEDLHKNIWEMEQNIRKYQDLQKEMENATLKDAVEWQSEIKSFDASVDKVKRQLTEYSSLVELLRKNAARLRGHNLMFDRLARNPGSYYSQAGSVETYFTEVLTSLRTEVEILNQELTHLENLHEDLLRPNENYNPLDLQATYNYLTKIVNGVALAVDENIKIGDDLRRELQVTKVHPIPPVPTPQPLNANVAQALNATKTAFMTPTPSTPVTQNLARQSKSPLLQPLSSDAQFTMFSPAMRSYTRMDSFSGVQKSADTTSRSPSASRLQMGGTPFRSTMPGSFM